jgi:two-component system, NarL family, response regulator LiaR
MPSSGTVTTTREASRPLTRVVIADEQPLMLEGVRRVLEESNGFEIVGEARVGTDLLALIEGTDPDVVLLDMGMPGVDGPAYVERIRTGHPKVKVVVLSVRSEPAQIHAALVRGASAYIMKNIDPLDLPSAIRQAVEGTVFHLLSLRDTREEGVARAAGLTEKELVVIKAVARGLSNQAIAGEMWVTEQTVKFHLTNVYRKLQISNRTEAARWALEQGIAGCEPGSLAH